HFLLIKAFGLLKEKGIRYFELGEDVINSLHYQPNEKEINISKFKKNFGCETILKSQSEFFFNENYFKQTMKKRIDSYAKSEFKGAIK
ncbi:MAG: hypothetical protein ACFFCV_20075, partial [Promethearchaeota archaeon]